MSEKRTKNESKTLFDILQCPKEYEFDRFLACTYSANELTINALKKCLGVYCKKENLVAWEKGENCCIYVQQGGYTGKQLPNFVHSIELQNGKNMHAKVYCVRYKRKIEEQYLYKYKVVITSANLTNSKELNAYVLFEGSVDLKVSSLLGNNTSPLGVDIHNIFWRLAGSDSKTEKLVEEFWGDADKIVFDNGISKVRLTDSNILNELEEKSKTADEVLIISPFLSNDILSKLMPNDGKKGKYKLVSRATAMDEIGKKALEHIECYTLNESETDDEENEPSASTTDIPEALHAKIYCFYNKENKMVYTYLGSANATNSAFYGNFEVLTDYSESGCENGLGVYLTMFCSYEPVEKSDEANEKQKLQKAFEEYARACFLKFKVISKDNNKRYYSLEDCEKHMSAEFMIDGQSANKENNFQVECTNTRRHLVTVKVIEGEYSAEKMLMVDGMPYKIDENALEMEQQTYLTGKFFTLGKSETNTTQADKRVGSATSGNGVIVQEILYTKICKLRKKEDIEIFLKNVEDEATQDMINHLDKAKRDMLLRAIEQLRDMVGKNSEVGQNGTK